MSSDTRHGIRIAGMTVFVFGVLFGFAALAQGVSDASMPTRAIDNALTVSEGLIIGAFLLAAGAVVWKGGGLERDVRTNIKAVEELGRRINLIDSQLGDSRDDRARLKERTEEMIERLSRVERRCDTIHGIGKEQT